MGTSIGLGESLLRSTADEIAANPSALLLRPGPSPPLSLRRAAAEYRTPVVYCIAASVTMIGWVYLLGLGLVRGINWMWG